MNRLRYLVQIEYLYFIIVMGSLAIRLPSGSVYRHYPIRAATACGSLRISLTRRLTRPIFLVRSALTPLGLGRRPGVAYRVNILAILSLEGRVRYMRPYFAIVAS